MYTSKVFKALAVLCCLSLSFLAQPSLAAGPVTIKVSMTQPEGDIFVQTVRDTFKKIVEEKTQGRYVVDIYSGGSLGNSDTVFQGVQFGTLHFGVESTANISQFIPQLSVFDMPYMFPTLSSIGVALKSPGGQELLELFPKKNVLVMGVLPSTFRVIATTVPVAKLEDVSGLKLRTTASKTHMSSIKSLGMMPTPMPVSEMLSGLQQGVVQGLDPDLNFLVGASFVDVGKNVFLSDHIPVCYMMYCSARWLKKLPKEDQEIIKEAARTFEAVCLQRNAEFAQKILAELAKRPGVVLVQPSAEEKSRWKAKSAAVYEELPANLKKIAFSLREAAAKE